MMRNDDLQIFQCSTNGKSRPFEFEPAFMIFFVFQQMERANRAVS